MNMIEKRRQMRGQGGFTLIELLVVIAILGILAGVVGSIRQNAAVNACKTEKATFETAADAASIDSNDNIASYLKTTTGKYFQTSGTNGFASRTAPNAPPSGC